MRIYSVVLTMLSGDTAPEGPGWYILATSPNAQLPARRVSSDQAETIARSYEEAIPPGDETVLLHPFQVVKEGSVAAREVIKEELEEAEEAAKRVAGLRRLLGDVKDE